MKSSRFLTFLLALLLPGCAGVSGQKENTAPPLPVPCKVACLGDSITEGMGVYDPENLWINVLARDELISSVQNCGISGTTVAVPSEEGYGPWAYVNRYREIEPNADLIIVFGGTNDYGHDVPLGESDDTNPGTFYGALNILAAGLSADYPNARLLFLTPLQRDDRLLGSPTTTPYNYAGVTMEDYCGAIKKVCEKNGIEMLDLYHLEGMRLDDPTFSDFFDDGLHPNDQGSAFLGQAILKKIREMAGR